MLPIEVCESIYQQPDTYDKGKTIVYVSTPTLDSPHSESQIKNSLEEHVVSKGGAVKKSDKSPNYSDCINYQNNGCIRRPKEVTIQTSTLAQTCPDFKPKGVNTNYLIRIIRYQWNPLTKSVQQKPVASKSISLPNSLDANTLKRVFDLVSKEFSMQKVDER